MSPIRNAAGGSARAITAADIAWCASGTSGTVTWRHNWAKANRLKAKPPFNRNDAVETAIAWQLAQPPRQKKATAAWTWIRVSVLELILAGNDDDIWLVIGSEGYRHAAVAGPEAAARAAGELAVACFMLPTASVVEAAKARYVDMRKGQHVIGGVSAIDLRQRAPR